MNLGAFDRRQHNEWEKRYGAAMIQALMMYAVDDGIPSLRAAARLCWHAADHMMLGRDEHR